MGIALGAIKAGVRAYYAYPMSPASSILTHLANFSHDTGMLIKQAEDEITAAQMALGSMFMGTRSFTATSGGGFDLMTETVSVAGIMENPLVIVLAQRPGPGTGLPTWTAQGDLKMAIHSSHGEFTKIVLAASDPLSAYELIQHAMNLAEQYQTPVVLLTEKAVGEAQMMVDLDKAEEQARRSVEIQPTTQGEWDLGLAEWMKGDRVGAERAFRNALALTPSARAHFMLGLFYMDSGRNVEAIREYRAGLQLDPGNADAVANLKKLEFLEGKD